MCPVVSCRSDGGTGIGKGLHALTPIVKEAYEEACRGYSVALQRAMRLVVVATDIIARLLVSKSRNEL